MIWCIIKNHDHGNNMDLANKFIPLAIEFNYILATGTAVSLTVQDLSSILTVKAMKVIFFMASETAKVL